MKTNNYILYSDYAELVITSRTHGEVRSKIDLDAIDQVKKHNWWAYYNRNIRGFYIGCNVRVNKKHKQIDLHRFLMQAQLDLSPSLTVDHINRDPLDNRRANLRLASHSQQSMNRGVATHSSTGMKGVTFRAKTQRYEVSIYINKKMILIGAFRSLLTAASAYNFAALILHKDFAVINHSFAILTEAEQKSIHQRISAHHNLMVKDYYLLKNLNST